MQIKTEQLRRIIQEELQHLTEDARGMRDATDHAHEVAVVTSHMAKNMKQLANVSLVDPRIDSDEITASAARAAFKWLRGQLNRYADALDELARKSEEKKELYLRQSGPVRSSIDDAFSQSRRDRDQQRR